MISQTIYISNTVWQCEKRTYACDTLNKIFPAKHVIYGKNILYKPDSLRYSAKNPHTSDSKRFRTSSESRIALTSSWFVAFVPSAAILLVMQENPTAFMPLLRATITSGAVDMPTASAKSPFLNAIDSASVSNVGPVTAR